MRLLRRPPIIPDPPTPGDSDACPRAPHGSATDGARVTPSSSSRSGSPRDGLRLGQFPRSALGQGGSLLCGSLPRRGVALKLAAGLGSDQIRWGAMPRGGPLGRSLCSPTPTAGTWRFRTPRLRPTSPLLLPPPTCRPPCRLCARPRRRPPRWALARQSQPRPRPPPRPGDRWARA